MHTTTQKGATQKPKTQRIITVFAALHHALRPVNAEIKAIVTWQQQQLIHLSFSLSYSIPYLAFCLCSRYLVVFWLTPDTDKQRVVIIYLSLIHSQKGRLLMQKTRATNCSEISRMWHFQVLLMITLALLRMFDAMYFVENPIQKSILEYCTVYYSTVCTKSLLFVATYLFAGVIGSIIQ